MVPGNTGNLVKTVNGTNYAFAGWTTTADGSGTVYSPDGENPTYTMGNTSVTFYAKWAVASLTVGTGDPVDYPTLRSAFEAARDASGETKKVTLLTDFTEADDLYAESSFTFDLNGKTLTFGNNKYFYINENVDLTISGTGGGTIEFNSESFVSNAGTLTVSGGTIRNNHGAAIENHVNLIISGGTVSGTTSAVSNYCDSAKYCGSVKITGGTVSATSENDWAAAVTNAGTGGGTISISGDAVLSGSVGVCSLYGSVTITGGTITGTRYGVYNDLISELNISGGGTITGSGADGVGVAYQDGSFKLSGAPVISGSKDVNIAGINKITISGTLTNTEPIGITLEDFQTGVFTSGLKGKGYASNFTSDEGYSVGLTAEGEAILGFAVTYDGNGNTGGTAPAAAVGDQNNPVYAAPSDTFTKTGYTFSNWNTEQAPSETKPGEVYNAGAQVNPSADMTLYAQWTANSYTVVFDKNAADATGTMAEQSFTYDAEPTALRANAYKRAGYLFGGWNTASDGSGDPYAEMAEVRNLTADPDGEVTLYARWTVTKVSVGKLDAVSGNALAGAKLQVIDGAGSEAKSWTSTENVYEIEKLAKGVTYTLHEEEAPAGYAAAADTTFTIGEDGKVTTTDGELTPEGVLVVRDKRKITASAEDVNVTYNGKPHSITLSIKDAVSGDDLSGAVVKYGTEAGSYDLNENPAYTDVDEYTVYYQVSKDNYETAEGSAKVTISKAKLTITANDQEYDWTGMDQGEGDTVYEDPAEIAKKVTVEGLQGSDALTSIILDGHKTDVGIYEALIEPSQAAINEGAATDNYEINYVKGKLTIKKASGMTVTAVNYEGVYDAAAHDGGGTPSVTEGTTLVYSTDGGTSWSETVPSVTNVGTVNYIVKASNPNYADAEDEGTLTVTAAELTITVKDQEYTYSGSPRGEDNAVYTAAADITGKVKAEGLQGSDALTSITLNGQETDAGEYPGRIEASAAALGSAAGNYDIQYAAGKLTIEKAENPAVITGTAEVVRGGNTVDLSANVSGAEGGVTYGVTTGTCTVDPKTGVLTSGTDAGSCTVTVTVEGNKNYKPASGTIEVTVTDKDTGTLTVTQEDVTYGESVPDPDYDKPAAGGTVTVLYSGTKADGTAYGPSADKPADAGSYAVSVTYETSDTVYTGGGRFTIARKEITVSVRDKIVIYSGDEQYGGSEPVFSGLAGGHTASISYTPAHGTEVSETAYDNGVFGDDLKVEDASGNDVTANYDLISKTPGKLTIMEDPTIYRVTVRSEGGGAASASPASGTKGTPVTLKVDSIEDGYSFKEWKVVSGDVTISGNTFNIGNKDVEILAVFEAVIPEDSMDLDVEIINYSGSKNEIPSKVKKLTEDFSVQLRDGKKVVSESENVTVTFKGGTGSKKITVSGVRFNRKISGGLSGYSVYLKSFPEYVSEGTGRNRVNYRLKYNAWVKDDKTITIYLAWRTDDDFGPVIIPLPEDEIGAYVLRPDKTKEYLIFQTYETCMWYLGDEELCAGHERCYHKEGVYGIDWWPAQVPK